MKLPPHLKKLVGNLDKGLDVEGKPLKKRNRKALGKMIGATHYKDYTGKLKKL